MKSPSFIDQLAANVEKGALLLDDQHCAQVYHFIQSLQCANGGFADRGGIPDSYYSLFAHLILKRHSASPYRKQLLHFIETTKIRNNQWVDICCKAILARDLNGKWTKQTAFFFSALNAFRRHNYGGSMAYQSFLFLLLLDSYSLNNLLTRKMALHFIPRLASDASLPCPVLAASMILKYQLGLSVEEDKKLLISYYSEGEGFRAHLQAPCVDLLSTSIAVYALKFCGEPLALMAPSCLQFAANCFSDGAFVAGDGDLHRDAEYTFYGLLCLGALS